MSESNTSPAWWLTKRRSKLNPIVIQQIYTFYLENLRERGITTTDEVKMVRQEIATEAAEEFGIAISNIKRILDRVTWNDQPLPDDWIPFI